MLVLSHYLESHYAMRLLEQHPGGVGYLLKERVSGVGVLADALARVHEGECVVDPTIVSRLLRRARPASALGQLGLQVWKPSKLYALNGDDRKAQVALDLTEVRPRLYEIFRATHLTDLFDIRQASTGNILVVEDDETLRRAVSKGLARRGFSVIEASDGSVALDLIHAHQDEIDVVLLDVTLPGASSREVFEEALRIRTDLKVIVTSAYDKEMVDTYYSGLRVDHFIRKPFHLDDLVRLSGTALSAKAH
jgi:CheY-like chemotaxis protein